MDSFDKLLLADEKNLRQKTLKDIAAAAQARIRVARGKAVAAQLARLCQSHSSD